MEDTLHAAEARRRKTGTLLQSFGACLHVPDWQVEGKCPMEINSLDTWTAVMFACADKCSITLQISIIGEFSAAEA